MFRSKEDICKEKEEKEKIAKHPANQKLKYSAIGFAISGIAILIILILGLDLFSLTTFLILRGWVGICAILFIILVACYLYRVNYNYYKQKNKVKNNELSSPEIG